MYLFGCVTKCLLTLFLADCPPFLLQGLVDLDVEISKCEKKLDLARLNLNKITKIEAQPDYEETIPANVRLSNEEKVWIRRLSALRT